ncbi:MAG: NUDIX domain-containing protein [Devosia sp.]|nr:NUDIX domain-containing protein [Devosia sp.]
MIGDFLGTVGPLVERYRAELGEPDERLALLRWQIAAGHRLDDRGTMPGHVTTSAFVVSPDLAQVLLIHHRTIGRWLQPGGHYEPAASFTASAAREAVEETAVQGLRLHPWHAGGDLPLVIDSHEVPGKLARRETDHYHHDLQYLFIADPALPLVAQEEEVHGARWFPLDALADVSPRGLARILRL